MTEKLAINHEQLIIVRDILRRYLPEAVQVAAFGSRASGRPKAMSDLDLVLEGPEVLALSLLAELAEAFEQSDLPWKVDLVDRNAVSTSFGTLIDETKVPLD